MEPHGCKPYICGIQTFDFLSLQIACGNYKSEPKDMCTMRPNFRYLCATETLTATFEKYVHDSSVCGAQFYNSTGLFALCFAKVNFCKSHFKRTPPFKINQYVFSHDWCCDGCHKSQTTKSKKRD